MNAIRRHHSVEKTLQELNRVFKIIVFQVYFSVAPVIDFTIFIVTRKDTDLYLKLLCTTIGVNCFLLVFVLNYLCAKLSKIAHQSYPLLYSFVLRVNLSLSMKMRIQAFMERLSGPEIQCDQRLAQDFQMTRSQKLYKII